MLTLGVFCLFQGLVGVWAGPEASTARRLVLNIDEFVIVAASWGLLWVLLLRPYPLNLPVWRACALFMLVAVVASLVAEVPLSIWGPQLLLTMKGWLLFFIFATGQPSLHRLSRYVRLVAFAGLVIVAGAAFELVSPQAFAALAGRPPSGEVRGGILSVESFFVHPGDFGWFTTLLALYAFAFYAVLRRRAHALLSLLCTVAALLSMRRCAVVGLAVAVAAALFILPRRRGLVAASLLCAAALALAFHGPLASLVEHTQQTYWTAGHRQARVLLYEKSVQVAADYFPLGAGLGRYGSWMSRVHYSPLYEQYGLSGVWGLRPDMDHFINDAFWPMILGETGVLGLALYGWMAASLLSICWRGYRRLAQPLGRAFCLGTLLVLVQALVSSLANPVLTAPPEVYFLFGGAGMAAALANQGGDAGGAAGRPGPPVRRWRRPLALGAGRR